MCDVGSGAGLPGVIISILLEQLKVNLNLSLIEANKKKCLFLDSVRKQLGLNFKIVNQRAEKFNEKQCIIMARALSPLRILIKTVRNLIDEDTIMVLHKGASWQSEVRELKNKWKFKFNIVKNNKLIDVSGGVTIIITNLQKKL